MRWRNLKLFSDAQASDDKRVDAQFPKHGLFLASIFSLSARISPLQNLPETRYTGNDTRLAGTARSQRLAETQPARPIPPTTASASEGTFVHMVSYARMFAQK
jgi:hypothetical protein